MGRGIGDMRDLDGQIRERRLVDTTRNLVDTPSFSGDEEAIASLYADILRDAGADVILDRTFPESPTVIGRIAGGPGRPSGRPNAILQLAGHLDTIPVDDGQPRIREGRIYGRGSCDMKSGLAVITELVRIIGPVIKRSGTDLLVTAYGLHEGPGAAPMHAPLRDLIQRGILGDAVIVAEGPRDFVPVAGKGSVVFKMHITRPGVVEHEILHDGVIPNPVQAAHNFVSRLDQASARWTARHALLGGETYFLGAFNGGDLYNRIALEASLEGTRRYPLPRTFAEASDEILAIGREVGQQYGLQVEVAFDRSGQPFEIDPASPIIGFLRESYSEVTGRPLPTGGQLFAADINHFVVDGGVPVAAHGPDPGRAHATPEWVAIDDITRCTRVLLLTAARYVASMSSSQPEAVA